MSLAAVVVGALSRLLDVNLTSPTNGQALTYNSSTGKWVNTTPSSTGASTLQLDFVMAVDISALNFVTGGTWQDFLANQNFTVASASSIIEISVSGMAFSNYAGALETATRIVIDSGGTPIIRMCSGTFQAGSSGGNLFAGTNTIRLTGLAPGVHTIKIQFNASTGSTSWYCRAQNVAQEFLNISILESP